ncbi:hypothetical protein LO762_02855 [Actinocorallia sp. API 0066]|uniref:hypothetical protein n=1 Tax=Actinocorallia sp. API 0066 TaxID=2896846 RepID=UPI001E5618B2|nr:hypothetical protein [Actinocorallia sp. API 0066]MCD0448140.1 hypothetical protein [Actinocorallia sp. API 0066]
MEAVVLGWTADEATVGECRTFGGIRNDETVVRIPLDRMAPFLRRALERLEELGEGDDGASGAAGS